jgi:hypothetical protein
MRRTGRAHHFAFRHPDSERYVHKGKTDMTPARLRHRREIFKEGLGWEEADVRTSDSTTTSSCSTSAWK